MAAEKRSHIAFAILLVTRTKKLRPENGRPPLIDFEKLV